MARRHRRVVIDLGTGDGRAVLAEAAADADAYVIGVDADARAMAESSRRAVRRPLGPGPSNTCFIASGVEFLPADLDRIADRVTVRFPWGSLLRGALGLDRGVGFSMARLVAPSGRLELTVSLVARDRPSGRDHGEFGDADLARMAAAFESFGFDLVAARPLPQAELAATHSTWARRLQAGHERAAWQVSFVRRHADRPDLLLADEPTRQLDSAGTVEHAPDPFDRPRDRPVPVAEGGR